MWWFLSLVVISLIVAPGRPRRLRGSTDSGQCNITVNGEEYKNGYFGPMSLRPPPVTNGQVGHPLLCTYTFKGVHGQRVLFHVKKLSVGEYDDENKSCNKGHMTIWDGSRDPGRHRYPPNILCKGPDVSHINFRRFSTGKTLEVEFMTAHALSHTSFQATYKFINVEIEIDLYPLQISHDMFLDSGSASVCQWTVSLEDCENEQCSILSPGYPGSYPPNTECVYHVVSGDPDVVIQLKFQGNAEKPREFSIRNTPDCKTEYLAVYDGDSTNSPLIGRFCKPGVPDITASGHNVFLVFVSGTDEPPYSFRGFHLSALKLTREWDQDSYKIPGKTCDWIFNAPEGSVSSPDHWLPKRTTCSYIFNVKSGNYLEIMLNVYGLVSDCEDEIKIYQDKKMVERLCAMTLPEDKPPVFIFNVTGREVTVGYWVKTGQMQSDPERGFWMSYRQLPVPTISTQQEDSSQDKIPQRVIDPVSGTPSIAAWRVQLTLAFVSLTFVCLHTT